MVDLMTEVSGDTRDPSKLGIIFFRQCRNAAVKLFRGFLDQGFGFGILKMRQICETQFQPFVKLSCQRLGFRPISVRQRCSQIVHLLAERLDQRWNSLLLNSTTSEPC